MAGGISFTVGLFMFGVSLDELDLFCQPLCANVGLVDELCEHPLDRAYSRWSVSRIWNLHSLSAMPQLHCELRIMQGA